MNRTLVGTILGCCCIALAATAQGQVKQKPGLYEVTMQMDMGMAGAPAMPPHTGQVCVTQAMIDKYGGGYSNSQAGCQTSNVSITTTGMTANVTCTGRMNMTGKVQSTFVDANTVKTTVEMTVTMPNGQTMNTTTHSTYVYKGPDCGSVKPPPTPPSSN